MAIAEREIRRGPVVPKQPSRIQQLETKLHEGRLAIKGLDVQVEMFQTLARTGNITQEEFATQKATLMARKRSLGYEQHATRRELRPLKKETEERKSPFKKPETQPQPRGVIFRAPKPIVRPNRRNHSFELNQQLHELWVLRKAKKLTSKEYIAKRRALKGT